MAVDFIVPGTKFLFAQQSTMSCWATCYTMMNSWKQKRRAQSIRAMIAALGQPWLRYFDANTGLPFNEGQNFERATNLVREPRVNFSPQGWESKLRAHGLLWVSTIVPGGVHDRIVEGIVGDETGPGTQVHLMDPDGGRRYTTPLAEFVTGYEGQAGVEPFYDDYQVLHFR